MHCQETEQYNSRGHDGSFQAPGGLTHNLESGLKRLRIAGQVLQTVMAETMQVVMKLMILMINYEAVDDDDLAKLDNSRNAGINLLNATFQVLRSQFWSHLALVKPLLNRINIFLEYFTLRSKKNRDNWEILLIVLRIFPQQGIVLQKYNVSVFSLKIKRHRLNKVAV